MKNKMTYGLDIKQLTDDGQFEGYVSVFGNIDHGNDVVERGAFTKSLRGQQDKIFPLLHQHNTDEVIGGFKAQEDEKGLFMKDAFFNLDVQRGRESHSNAKKGLLTGFSIGFGVDKQDVEPKTGLRFLKELTLFEGSIVTFPMNQEAQLTDIKAASDVDNIRDFEKFLRDAGFSRKRAVQIASGGFLSEEEQREAEHLELMKSLNNLFNFIKGKSNG